MDSDTLKKLAQYDSPTVANVIELFDVRPRNQGFMDSRIRSCFPEMPPMVGYAATASFRSDAAPPSADAYGSINEQIEQFSALAGPAVVVFQDLDDSAVGATFGEVMCSTYKAFGAVGLITSGGGRDLAQVRNLDFPVFTGATIVSHAYCHLLHVGQPVRVGGLTVTQGDLLHGDENGVTEIPGEIAADVADVAEEFVAAEKIILDYVQGSDRATLDGLKARQVEFAQAVQRLRARVRT